MCNIIFRVHFLRPSQTYEGGYGAQPGIEAHGGYTFCAAAALCLLGRADFINIPRLLHWVAHRQMASEGGFQVNFIVAGYGPMSNS